MGPSAAAAERNVIGVIGKVGREAAAKVIEIRGKLREIVSTVAGKAIHPVFGLPGGVSKPISRQQAAEFRKVGAEAVEFAQFTLALFEKIVLGSPEYLDLIRSEMFTHRTYYMGMVDDRNRVAFYDGVMRIVSPSGHDWGRFPPEQYRDYIAEHAEPWSYMKFCHLKAIGWQGITDGEDSGIYSVAPLARLNASEGMATPLAHEAYLKFVGTLGGKPVHHTLANHWARLIEMLFAAERTRDLANDDEICDDRIRELPAAVPAHGVGVVEAPRGTLFHDYTTDGRGLITKANLLVATQNNAGRIAMSIEKAARSLITEAAVDERILNMIEMALRAYDPCLGCATHSLPGSMPLIVQICGPDRGGITTLRRDCDGTVRRE